MHISGVIDVELDSKLKPEPKTDQEEAVPFDDCLRFLVNTPPKPKKAEQTTEQKNQAEEAEAS